MFSNPQSIEMLANTGESEAGALLFYGISICGISSRGHGMPT